MKRWLLAALLLCRCVSPGAESLLAEGDAADAEDLLAREVCGGTEVFEGRPCSEWDDDKCLAKFGGFAGPCEKSVWDDELCKCVTVAVQPSEAWPCDDGDQCTTADVCVEGGACAGEPLDCDDGLWCNGSEHCSEEGDGCVAGEAPEVDDGVECTLDQCDEDNDEVVHTPDHAFCDDGNICTDNTCDIDLGCQSAPNPDACLTGDFQVNTYNFDTQGLPVAATLEGGDFLIMYQSYMLDDSSWGVGGQLFDPSGQKLGGELTLNSLTAEDQNNDGRSDKVAPLPGGGFAACWGCGPEGGPTGYDVRCRIFDDAGLPQGPDFQVNQFTDGNQWTPSVGQLDNGGFVVLWQSQSGVVGRTFDAAGNPEGDEQPVSVVSGTGGPRLARQANGGLVAAWRSEGYGSGYDIVARFLDTSGAPFGPEIMVNETLPGSQTQPAVAALGGAGFVVVWNDGGANGSVVRFRLFDPEGAALGPETEVPAACGCLMAPDVAGFDDGRFVVVWQSWDDEDVYAMRYAPGGIPSGEPFVVHETTVKIQWDPCVAAIDENRFVVAWTATGGLDGNGYGVFARIVPW